MRAITSLLALFLFSGCAHSLQSADLISRDQMTSDLVEWHAWMMSTHPDPGYTMSQEELAQFERAATLAGPHENVREAWLKLSMLNGLFHDAHTGIRVPEQAFEEALREGAAKFPVAIEVIGNDILLRDNPDIQIVSINSQSAGDIVERLLPRMRGDDQVLKARVLSLQFPVAIWALLGDQEAYEIVARDNRSGRSISMQELLNSRTPARSEPFELTFRDEAAILTTKTFEIGKGLEFQAFLASAFQRIANRGVTRLLIDLRENGGGASDLSDQLMAYITDKKYTPISRVKARITSANQALVPNSKIGQVINLPFQQWVSPPPELENRYDGEVGILIGPYTYSQAIAFSATAADHGFATLLGEPTSGRVNQTGQVQRHVLSQSGLMVQAPIYIFTRASGEQGQQPLVPDIKIPGTSDDTIEAALAADWQLR